MRHPMLPFASTLIALIVSVPVWADATPQPLPFAQDWSNTALIGGNNDWSGVPGIQGYRGDGLVAATGVDPRTVLADGTHTPLSVLANQTSPDTLATGGVAEFHLADPVVALNGSGTADAPFLLIHLDTRGWQSVRVRYVLRDLDGSADNALQSVALHYRVGSSGDFVNVPAAYVADATDGPSLAGKRTSVNVVLPADAGDQPWVQLRILTTNAVGNDEWVGIDDIVIDAPGGVVNAPIVASCPTGLAVAAGGSGSLTLSASDADSIVNAASIVSGAITGISLNGFNGAMMDGETATVSLDVAGLAAGSYPVTVRFDNNEAQSATCTVTVTASGVTPIPVIQGSGATSPLEGQTVTTEGVVTRVNNNGFFMQDETGDGDPATSDGIFVFTGAAPTVAAGQKVRLTGQVTEFNTGAATNALTLANPVTELTGISGLTVLPSGHAVLPVTIPFPETVDGELERYEGMLVRIDAELTASQNYFQGRYGQVTVSAGGRLVKPTNLYRPGSPEALALADDNARRRLILDDGTSAQNPVPIPYIGDDNTLRAGDTLPGIVGVIDYGLATSSSSGLADYRIHPVEPVNFERVNARTAAPGDVGGNVRVASFNVLNYFTTLNQAGASCFPSGTASDCRGANNATEFARQQAKIVAALAAIRADAVGLIEIENNGETAVNNLVAALNAAMGAGTYASVGLPAGGTGGDAIRMAIIYRPAKLAAVGSALSDTDPDHNRPPLAQTFAAANGEKFTLVVNHFKSKGSCPVAGDANADQGDGQGCWNARRVQQSQALQAFVASLQASSGSDDVVVMGDLNAYGREDPVAVLLDNGYVDLISRFNGDAGYSYVFDGEAGYLDHALATPSLSAHITGATEWHINADEPSVIDYNTEFKPQDLYAPSAYRSSDHDPVVVGLSLLKTLTGTAGRDVIVGTPGDDVITGGPGADTLTGGAGSDVFVYVSMRDADDTITDFVPGVDRLDLAQLLASLGISQGVALAYSHVRVVDVGGGASVQIDADGAAGAATFRPLATLRGVSAAAIDPVRDLGL